MFDIELHQQIEQALKVILVDADPEWKMQQTADGHDLFIHGVDREGIITWDTCTAHGGEKARYAYFEWVDVPSVAEIPAGVIKEEYWKL
ncbi:hypothetical protein MMC30_003225 [Trapelia coarctata]|nr:hypothetical protein [Trapelia coarctata]